MLRIQEVVTCLHDVLSEDFDGRALSVEVVVETVDLGIGMVAVYQIEGDAVICTISGGNVDAPMFIRALQSDGG